jgi:glycosyltransferase involved in cell wall biosynthesis
MVSTARPSPLRLTLVTETFPPEVNGVARTLGRWVETFRARGHVVHVVRPRQWAEGPTAGCVHGLPLPYYPHMRFGVASPLRLRALLGRDAPDLVHIATEGPLGWAALVAATSLGLPVATSFHTNFDHYLDHYGLGPFGWLLFAYLRWFHNRAGVTLVPSEATRRRLRAGGVRRLAIWSRGVDARAFHPRFRDPALRGRLGLGDDGVLLIYVGRLAAEKNLSALLAAFARLRLQLPPAKQKGLRLALVGDGPLAGQLRALQAPGVVLTGQLHGSDLSRWYASGDVFAFPSCSETFGNVVLEAQANGLPVVGFDVAPVNERVAHGADGLLVPAGDDLAGALRLLCEDRGLREQFGAAARARAEKQDWQPIFDALEARYRRLIAGQARRHSVASPSSRPC